MSKPEETFSLQLGSAAFTNWSEIEVIQSLDAFSQVIFKAPFEPDRKEFRELFRPFSYLPVEVWHGPVAAKGLPRFADTDNKLVFTGTLMHVDPTIDENGKSVTVECYSRAAVIEDACLPYRDPSASPPKTPHYDPSYKPSKALPREFLGLSLFHIAAQLCEPFGLSVRRFSGSGGDTPFEKVRIESTGKIHDFLVDLARQRGFVVRDDADGAVLFDRGVTKDAPPVCFLEEGKRPLLSIRPTFQPQNYFSQIECVTAKKRGKPSVIWTERNPHLSGSLRPNVATLDDIEAADVAQATRARMARMFGNVVSYELELPGHEKPDGGQWVPNENIDVIAPGAMIYGKTRLLIRTVARKTTPDGKKTTLRAVLPGAFAADGDYPAHMPWDEPPPNSFAS